jgi:hypothetical protein
MIGRGELERSLRSLDRRYRGAAVSIEAQLASKGEVIEVCGWIEEAIDDLVRRTARRALSIDKSLKEVDEVIQGTYGFSYAEHVRPMLKRIVGLSGVEQIEAELGALALDRLRGVLGELKAVRNTNAHTHLKGATPRLDAPSLTTRRFHEVRHGLTELEKAIRKVGY